MPIHSTIAAKLYLLEGVTSFEAAMTDPEQRALLDEFMSITGAPQPPQVETRNTTAPGPLPAHQARGNVVQLLVHEGHEFVECAPASGFPFL